jgi:acetate kinase
MQCTAQGICHGLEVLGIKFDTLRNQQLGPSGGVVSHERGRLQVLAIPTGGEHMIAEDTYEIVAGGKAE